MCVVFHVVENVVHIHAYVVFELVAYLQVAFSSVSSVRFTAVVPDACSPLGVPFERIGAVVSGVTATEKFNV